MAKRKPTSLQDFYPELVDGSPALNLEFADEDAALDFLEVIDPDDKMGEGTDYRQLDDGSLLQFQISISETIAVFFPDGDIARKFGQELASFTKRGQRFSGTAKTQGAGDDTSFYFEFEQLCLATPKEFQSTPNSVRITFASPEDAAFVAQEFNGIQKGALVELKGTFVPANGSVVVTFADEKTAERFSTTLGGAGVRDGADIRIRHNERSLATPQKFTSTLRSIKITFASPEDAAFVAKEFNGIQKGALVELKGAFDRTNGNVVVTFDDEETAKRFSTTLGGAGVRIGADIAIRPNELESMQKKRADAARAKRAAVPDAAPKIQQPSFSCTRNELRVICKSEEDAQKLERFFDGKRKGNTVSFSGNFQHDGSFIVQCFNVGDVADAFSEAIGTGVVAISNITIPRYAFQAPAAVLPGSTATTRAIASAQRAKAEEEARRAKPPLIAGAAAPTHHPSFFEYYTRTTDVNPSYKPQLAWVNIRNFGEASYVEFAFQPDGEKKAKQVRTDFVEGPGGGPIGYLTTKYREAGLDLDANIENGTVRQYKRGKIAVIAIPAEHYDLIHQTHAIDGSLVNILAFDTLQGELRPKYPHTRARMDGNPLAAQDFWLSRSKASAIAVENGRGGEQIVFRFTPETGRRDAFLDQLSAGVAGVCVGGAERIGNNRHQPVRYETLAIPRTQFEELFREIRGKGSATLDLLRTQQQVRTPLTEEKDIDDIKATPSGVKIFFAGEKERDAFKKHVKEAIKTLAGEGEKEDKDRRKHLERSYRVDSEEVNGIPSYTITMSNGDLFNTIYHTHFPTLPQYPAPWQVLRTELLAKARGESVDAYLERARRHSFPTTYAALCGKTVADPHTGIASISSYHTGDYGLKYPQVIFPPFTVPKSPDGVDVPLGLDSMPPGKREAVRFIVAQWNGSSALAVDTILQLVLSSPNNPYNQERGAAAMVKLLVGLQSTPLVEEMGGGDDPVYQVVRNLSPFHNADLIDALRDPHLEKRLGTKGVYDFFQADVFDRLENAEPYQAVVSAMVGKTRDGIYYRFNNLHKIKDLQKALNAPQIVISSAAWEGHIDAGGQIQEPDEKDPDYHFWSQLKQTLNGGLMAPKAYRPGAGQDAVIYSFDLSNNNHKALLNMCTKKEFCHRRTTKEGLGLSKTEVELENNREFQLFRDHRKLVVRDENTGRLIVNNKAPKALQILLSEILVCPSDVPGVNRMEPMLGGDAERMVVSRCTDAALQFAGLALPEGAKQFDLSKDDTRKSKSHNKEDVLTWRQGKSKAIIHVNKRSGEITKVEVSGNEAVYIPVARTQSIDCKRGNGQKVRRVTYPVDVEILKVEPGRSRTVFSSASIRSDMELPPQEGKQQYQPGGRDRRSGLARATRGVGNSARSAGRRLRALSPPRRRGQPAAGAYERLGGGTDNNSGGDDNISFDVDGDLRDQAQLLLEVLNNMDIHINYRNRVKLKIQAELKPFNNHTDVNLDGDLVTPELLAAIKNRGALGDDTCEALLERVMPQIDAADIPGYTPLKDYRTARGRNRSSSDIFPQRQ